MKYIAWIMLLWCNWPSSRALACRKL